MTMRMLRFVLMVFVVHMAAGAAMAFSFPGPFSFSFFNPAMNAWFLLPFTMAGCV